MFIIFKFFSNYLDNYQKCSNSLYIYKVDHSLYFVIINILNLFFNGD